MRKLVLYMGVSLDGFVADTVGGVEWMVGDGTDPNHQGSYPAFLESVDTIVMGRRTYDQVRYDLSPSSWPYPDHQTYVWSKRPLEEGAKGLLLPEDWQSFLAQTKREQGKDIWLCGGADLAQQALRAGLVDRIYLTMIPCLLGQGIALFGSNFSSRLTLVATTSYNGMVDLVYDLVTD